MNWIKKIKQIHSNTRKRKQQEAFYQQFIKKGDLCFDVGANVGSRTHTFSTLGAKVVAIEPTQNCCQILEKKFGNHPLVDILPLALGAQAGEGTLHLANYHEVSTLSTLFIEQYSHQEKHPIVWDKTIIIPLSTLDQLIQKYGCPQFCKIDVEGYETEVLKGLSQPIPYLSFEYNNRLQNKALECLKILSKFSNLEYNFSPYESMQLSLKKWLPQNDFYQYIQTLPKHILTGDIYVHWNPIER
ncbi:FkbM family methyltransferase [Aureispira sp. CCB-QB1]|uniref:FkbM family methyltransferase n=1 Tax=Aureispira sp. CCB-QB1 TaxID=1313421 RepID=UPI00069669E3|nr:FkbM family methyltransferase [Aureispira sp. CCB-QB1]